VPSYRIYVLRANRVDAKRALLSRAADFERCFTRNSSYLDGGAAAPCAVATNLPDASLPTYRIEVDPGSITGGTVGLTATSFVLRAVPINAQAKDTQCGNFRLDDKNNRAVTGTLSAQDCWGK
jgi:Tfp pilus assembly protein PilE